MITSLQNPLVKRLIKLRDKKDRQREGVFLIEGEKELLHAVDNGISLETVIYCTELMAENATFKTTEAIKSRLQSGYESFVEVTSKVYAKIAYRGKSGGILATAVIPAYTIDKLKLPENPLLLVIEGVEKPGNLGALLRTADGAGVDAAIICDANIDLYNPNVVRASLGALFTVPTLLMPLDDTINWPEKNRIKVVLSSPVADCDYTDADYTGPVAIVLGSEKEGLPKRLLNSKFHQVRIPLAGKMDSLNVSCAAAIILYEAYRQRKKS